MKEKFQNYRQRLFASYYITHWSIKHPGTQKEYLLYCKQAKKLWKKFLPRNKRAKILDLACGPGHFLYFLKTEGYLNSWGVEANTEMIKQAHQIGLDNIIQQDCFKFLKTVKEKYDFIVSMNFIEHLTKEEVLRFLDLIYKALLAEGQFLLVTPNAGALFGNLYRYADFSHEVAFTNRSLGQVLRVCGFKQIQILGQRPVPYDLRSGLRCILWKLMSYLYKFLLILEKGQARGLKKEKIYFEPSLIALAQKFCKIKTKSCEK